MDVLTDLATAAFSQSHSFVSARVAPLVVWRSVQRSIRGFVAPAYGRPSRAKSLRTEANAARLKVPLRGLVGGSLDSS